MFLAGLCGCFGDMAANSPGNRTNTTNANNLSANKPPSSETPVIEANSATGNHIDANDFYKDKNVNEVKTSPTPISTPPPDTSKKKEEGLFSFPPPKAVDVGEINISNLMNADGNADFAQISKKLADALKTEYDGKFTYFWNNDKEFAIVTQMERVDPKGLPLKGSERWEKAPILPTATWTTYWDYLFHGKKVYYRVLVFVVSAKAKKGDFMRGAFAEFNTAASWGEQGDSRLGDGDGTTEIEQTPVTGKFRVFALLYLFVNHTSLDAPKAVNNLADEEQELRKGINTDVKNHLAQTGINFGG